MDAATVQALDETRALTLALIELLNKKLSPGSFQKILSDEDVKKVLENQAKLVQAFREERDERSRGLLLPPGAKT
jgi:hypothetical protein